MRNHLKTHQSAKNHLQPWTEFLCVYCNQPPGAVLASPELSCLQSSDPISFVPQNVAVSELQKMPCLCWIHDNVSNKELQQQLKSDQKPGRGPRVRLSENPAPSCRDGAGFSDKTWRFSVSQSTWGRLLLACNTSSSTNGVSAASQP